MDDVGLDLLLRDGHVLQNDLQSHGHHTGHPVDQTGADVARHPLLENQEEEEPVESYFLLPFMMFKSSCSTGNA